MKQRVWLLAGFVALSGGCVGSPAEPSNAPVSGGALAAPAPSAYPTSPKPAAIAAAPAATAPKPAQAPCPLPAEIHVAVRNERVLLNGSDVEALSPDTPRPTPLAKLVENCQGEPHRYAFELGPNATAESTRELLNELPAQADRAVSLAIAGSPSVAVRRVGPRPSGHWVKLSVAPHRIAVRELRREKSQLEAAPTVASERELRRLSEAYTWLRSTCGREPCAGIILNLSPEQTNTVLTSALQAISLPSAQPPLFSLLQDDKSDTNELDSWGRLPPSEIQAVARTAYGEFRTCYEHGLARNRHLEGRVSVKFVIDRDGSVRSSDLESSTLPDAEVARCVVDTFLRLHFPKPESGIVTVVYPILLSPG